MIKLETLVPPLEYCKLIPRGEFADSAFIWDKTTSIGFWDGEDKEGNQIGGFGKIPHTKYRLRQNYSERCRKHLEDQGITLDVFPAPTLQEIMEAIGGIKEISYPDPLNPGCTISRDPQYEPSIEYFPGKNFSWRSKRWTNSIHEENETSAPEAALRTYLGIKKVVVTMPCPECGTWLQRIDAEHPEHESFDEFKVEISEFCPECGFKFYDGPFLFIHKEVEKYLLLKNTVMGYRWKKQETPSETSDLSTPAESEVKDE